MSIRTRGETRGAGTTFAPRRSADERDVERQTAPDVEEEVVDQDKEPGSYRHYRECDLEMIVRMDGMEREGERGGRTKSHDMADSKNMRLSGSKERRPIGAVVGMSFRRDAVLLLRSPARSVAGGGGGGGRTGTDRGG